MPLPANTFNPPRPSYYPTRDKSFRGWNTQADGSGDWYDPGTPVAISGNLTLYAAWDPYVVGGEKVRYAFDGKEYEMHVFTYGSEGYLGSRLDSFNLQIVRGPLPAKGSILVVAGGGGGGAGGYREIMEYAFPTLTGNISVIAGNGGVAHGDGGKGGAGKDSRFFDVQMLGGGGGAATYGSDNTTGGKALAAPDGQVYGYDGTGYISGNHGGNGGGAGSAGTAVIGGVGRGVASMLYHEYLAIKGVVYPDSTAYTLSVGGRGGILNQNVLAPSTYGSGGGSNGNRSGAAGKVGVVIIRWER